MNGLKDLTGQHFGHLTARWPAGIRGKVTLWLCSCRCGKLTITRTSDLAGGLTQSCGCLHKEDMHTHPVRLRHGHKLSGQPASPEYQSWGSMKARCYHPTHGHYHRYGGRGIIVCERWKHSFDNFLADMGPRPKEKSLDRWPNPDGNYEPGNCRWATRKEQGQNRSRIKTKK